MRHCFRVDARTAIRPTPGLTTLPWSATPEEERALAEVGRAMQACPYGAPDEATQQWFLRDRRLAVDAAVDKLTAYMKWRAEFLPLEGLTWEDVADQAGSGKAYLHAHLDVNGRPVIVVRVSKHVTGEFPLDSSKRYCAYVLEQAIARLSDDCETILGIFDLRGFRTRNADFGFVRFLVDVFFLYYPKRLGQVLFVDAPWGFQPGWELVKPWLKKYAALVRFVSVQQLREEFFTPETLPEDFA
ncbi:hypothetical protein WJX81_001198 [Elliptochloris bilobata]|uniref:CRAL-TRIO domain-containing protein n=1 Tax=Elliptochloris bilobata TaxID=381761 RepID=A0AAW1QKD5_9CHLO